MGATDYFILVRHDWIDLLALSEQTNMSSKLSKMFRILF